MQPLITAGLAPPHQEDALAVAQQPEDVVEVGDQVELHAYVCLGSLSPGDVDVQVVYGRVRGIDEELVDTDVLSLAPGDSYGGGRYRYEGTMTLARTGPFGYTVRVVPQHAGLASVAELGLVAPA